ncbi:MAG: M81 family metallopeptidase [Marinifilaceae bacterium]
MRTYQLFLATVILLASATVAVAQNNRKPRVGIAGIAIECSTFSPAQTEESAFRVRKGEEVFKNYDFLSTDSLLRQKAIWLPTMVSRATPGGIVTRECYESLTKQTIELLKQNAPYDALFLDIHGAMSVVGLDDPEGDFIVRVREAIGVEPIISTSMDPHGCVSHRLAKNTDLITSYRMSPHEDSNITRRRAVTNLLNRLESGKGRPAYKAWVNVPILLPGEKTSTRVEPGKSLYAAIEPIEKLDGVIDAAIWISYAWADEPRNHAVVVVTGDNKKQVEKSAKDLAKLFWSVRDKFEFVAPTDELEVCLANALKSDKKPYFISDMGDNPTAGGAGDVTWTLTEMLKRPEFKSENGPMVIYASIPGPELVKKAIAAGIGGKVQGTAGAAVDARYAPPVMIDGTVTAINEKNPNNREVVIKTGSIHIIVTELRKGFHYERDFVNLGFEPRKADIIMVKLGYLTEELYDMRGDWMMALTRGGVDQDLLKLPFKRINRPMYPLDPDMKTPSFKVHFIPAVK